MTNRSSLIKHNIFYCAYTSICTVPSSGMREHHKLVFSLNASVSQEVIYRCIIYLGILHLKPKLLMSLINLNDCILLEMCLVCVVSLPLSYIHTADLLSNILGVAFSGTISISL